MIMEASRKEYDVFLNFRGEDTRRNIADHLYLSLKEAHINVFMDDPSLPFGEEIERELLAAIENSKIAITIISESYASSDDCLKELAHILKCKERGIITVIPIFYKVKPSDIRSLRNSFQRIQTHIIKYHGTIVETWKEALKRIANMKGLIVDNTSYEGKIVRSIVEKVKEELKRNGKTYTNCLVGIDEKAREMMKAIFKNANDVHVVGIYGVSGIGKTTLARCIYEELLHNFDFCSFIADVQESLLREISMEEIISFIFEQGTTTKNNSDKDMNRIKHFFRNKKVLIVLDGVDSWIELRMLMRMSNYFGSGSTIILTTRNVGILNARELTLKFALNELNFAQSMDIFCKHAFRRVDPPDSFKAYSKRVVEICGGLPLALEVIGSSLFGKEEMEWKSILKKLEDVPYKDVENQLLLTYQALDDKQKQIFLNIASFPNGFYKNSLFSTLEALDTEALDKLEALSLVKFDNENKLHMHDLLRDLAEKIFQVEGAIVSRDYSQLWINESWFKLKESKEVFESTPLTREVIATPIIQRDAQGYFPGVQARTTTIAKEKEPWEALEQPQMPNSMFSDSLRESNLLRDSHKVPLQLSGKIGTSTEAKTSLSQLIAHLDFSFGEINFVLAQPRYILENELPCSDQEVIFFMDSFIKQINVPNVVNIDFTSLSFLQALEILRQLNALPNVPRELLVAFHSALKCFARTPEYLDQIQFAKNTFNNCMRAQTTKVDEICKLKHELALDKDALQHIQREIALLEAKLSSLKAKERELESKLNNIIPTISALFNKLKTCRDQLFEAQARFDDISTLQEHIKINHYRFLDLLHEIKNFLRRKYRNSIFNV